MLRPKFCSDSETPIWLVITGNIRSGAEFQWMFRQAHELRQQNLIDGILFSTWQSDLDSAPGLEDALEAAGISVIGLQAPNPDPKIHPLFHGFLYHQRKALHFALDALPGNVFVLKGRTDFAEERFTAMMNVVFGEGVPDLKTEIQDPIFQTRLFTFDARPDYFFYWDDIIFSGMRDDLLRLNNFDISSDVIYPGHLFSAECSLYAPLFLSHYPLLRWFFENTHGENFAKMLQKWITNGATEQLPELVIRILASYFHILSRYIALPCGPPPSGKKISLASFFSADDSQGIRAFPTPWESYKLFNETLLNQLRKPDLNTEDKPLRLIHQMMETMDREPVSRGEIPANMCALVREFEVFDQNLGTCAYAPQYVRPAKKEAGTSSDLSALTSLKIPEKRKLSWAQRKILGSRKKLAKFVFDKLL